MNLQELFRIGMDRAVPQSAKRPDKRSINLGVGNKEMPSGVVSIGLPEWNAETDPLPYANESIGEIWALHFLEHIDNVLGVLAECQRVLVPGGVMRIVVPYGACHMWVHDLTHKHMFNEDTWRQTFRNAYYGDKDLPGGWKFRVGLNLIMGVKGENLALFTELIKEH